MDLFPVHPEPGPRLVGIARLAAAGQTLEAKSQVEYFTLEARSILNRCDSPRVPFQWTINPYRGCEFGCRYCYARYTHEYMELDGRAFEEKIYAKQAAAELLRQELKKVGDGAIAIGTATDPYQPAERRFGVTRRILEVLAEHRGLRLSLTTKSNLVLRDAALLEDVARRNVLHVNVTITTLRSGLARALEPRAPRPDLRLDAVRQLAAAGLAVGVFAAPVLPAITDNPKDLDALFRAAAGSGAGYLMVSPLFLMPSAQKQFFPFLAQQFPELLEAYRRQYERGAYLRGDYRRRLGEVVGRLRQKYGLPPGPSEYPAEALQAPAQMKLFG